MKKYRLCYDKYFASNVPFEYKGEIIKGLDILFIYFLIEKIKLPQAEFVLCCNDVEEPPELLINGKRIDDFFDCYYDQSNFQKSYSVQTTECSIHCGFNVCGMPLNCFKYIENDIVQISHKELCSILYANPQYFNNSFNSPTANKYFKAIEYTPIFEQKTDHTFLGDENIPSYKIVDCSFVITSPVVIAENSIKLIDYRGTIFQEHTNY